MKGATLLKTHHLTLHQSQCGAGKDKEVLSMGRDGAGTAEKGGGFCERQRAFNSHIFSSIFLNLFFWQSNLFLVVFLRIIFIA